MEQFVWQSPLILNCAGWSGRLRRTNPSPLATAAGGRCIRQPGDRQSGDHHTAPGSRNFSCCLVQVDSHSHLLAINTLRARTRRMRKSLRDHYHQLPYRGTLRRRGLPARSLVTTLRIATDCAQARLLRGLQVESDSPSRPRSHRAVWARVGSVA